MHTPYISLSILHVHQLPSGMERSDVEPFEWLCCVYDDGFPGAPAMQEILVGLGHTVNGRNPAPPWMIKTL